MVVLRVVINVTGNVLFLNASNAMFEARGARNSVRTSQGFRVSGLRHEIRRVGGKSHIYFRQLLNLWNSPRLGAVSQVAIGEIEDWAHVFESQSHGFDCHVKTVGRRGRSQYDDRTLTISSPNRLEQIRLFRLGW